MSKKIMFNDKYSLTHAVLDGTKTMTRRIEKPTEMAAGHTMEDVTTIFHEYSSLLNAHCFSLHDNEKQIGVLNPRYQVGEVVAIAQSYKAIFDELEVNFGNTKANVWWYKAIGSAVVPPLRQAGYMNKMFTRADLLIHHIRITDVRMERLQDISDKDCMREGIKFVGELRADGYNDYYFSCRPTPKHSDNNMIGYFTSPREAYAVLINKISGNGTWLRNPWVVVYEFEKVD